MIDWLIVLMCR